MRLFLPLGSDRNLTRWRQALLLAKFLTMSLFCCFSVRDYGSKRKSGKSPALLDCFSSKYEQRGFFPLNLLLPVKQKIWCRGVVLVQDTWLSAVSVHFVSLTFQDLQMWGFRSGWQLFGISTLSNGQDFCKRESLRLPFVCVGSLPEFLMEPPDICSILINHLKRNKSIKTVDVALQKGKDNNNKRPSSV